MCDTTGEGLKVLQTVMWLPKRKQLSEQGTFFGSGLVTKKMTFFTVLI